MKDTLHYILSLIVEKPEALSVTEEDQDGIVHFIITVDTGDIGKVIGKEGKIIRSIRNIMKIPAMKQGKRINISLADTTPPPAA
jgi:uncharacterized protein